MLHADAIAATDFVRREHDLVWRHLLAVDCNAAALDERKRDLLDLVRRLLGPHAHRGLDDAHRGLHRLEVLRLVGETGEVGVGRIFLLRADERDDAALGEELDHLSAAGELRKEVGVAPRGVDSELRVHHVRVALEAHLVVAATRRAVDEGDAARLLHRGKELLHRDGARDAGGIPVAAVVHGLALHRLEADVGHFLRDVDDRRLNARGGHLLLDVVDILFVGLADVRAERLDLHARVLEDAADRLRVESARNADTDGFAFEISKFHDFVSPSEI